MVDDKADFFGRVRLIDLHYAHLRSVWPSRRKAILGGYRPEWRQSLPGPMPRWWRARAVAATLMRKSLQVNSRQRPFPLCRRATASGVVSAQCQSCAVRVDGSVMMRTPGQNWGLHRPPLLSDLCASFRVDHSRCSCRSPRHRWFPPDQIRSLGHAR